MVKICNTPYPTESENNVHFEQYPYPLSDFQKHAIQGIVEGNHVLVTAHTGSGKTLPALFAIDYFVKKGKKVIYTSPIKALSNQKYWEFSKTFGEKMTFGLLTGDIKTNPTADVLIMTTEILMNYLFRKDGKSPDFDIDIENELGCVVFDEVHYINDIARGHVWEQTILMLPHHIQMIMLSATIDQPEKFAEWIEMPREESYSTKETHSTKEAQLTKEVCLCSTETRVVPLTHYSFFTIGEGIFKGIKDDVLKREIREKTNKLIPIKSENGVFNEINYHQVKKMLTLFENKQQWVKRKFAVNSLMTFLKDREMLPAIIFVFSRKQVETLAQEITTNLLEDDSKIPYTVAKECEQIMRNKMTNFREYLELPEYNTLVKLLEKGIGIHHSGMIPVLREIVELFISKKYIKLLIATESFAIGLDCPIKTAIFISLTKFDGNQMRLLQPHEYSQMSGRAGRRGIDTIGNIIHCNNLFMLPSMADYKEILCGKPQRLESKFSISYSVIFSLLRVNIETETSIDVIKDFTKKSMIFRENQEIIKEMKKKIAIFEENLIKKKEFLKFLKTPEEILEKYISLKKGLEMASNKKRKDILKELSKVSEEHKSLEKDLISFSEKEKMIQELENERVVMREIDNFLENQIKNVISIMKKYQYLEEEETIKMTDKGKMASHFAEVHPLIFSQIIPLLKNLTPKQIVGLLSCFTDIRMESDEKSSLPQTEDTAVKNILLIAKNFYDELDKDECLFGITQDKNEMMFDCIDSMMEWCDCLDETACKYFIQQKICSEKGISIGDFTKAILKIVTIVNEIEKACIDNIEYLELSHKCSLIKSMILKYITTSQSLYI
jgi:superfamily II RNA helicase